MLTGARELIRLVLCTARRARFANAAIKECSSQTRTETKDDE
jgi:hypothetical protein